MDASHQPLESPMAIKLPFKLTPARVISFLLALLGLLQNTGSVPTVASPSPAPVAPQGE